ncbi:MAG: hypothetical protein ACREB3_10215 [Burkholderiales bacterium]
MSTGVDKAILKEELEMPATLPANPEKSQTEVKDTLNSLGLALFAALMLFPFLAEFMPLPLRQYLGAIFR